MTPTADASITALRSTHDELAALVRGLSDEQLLAGSGAAQWTVAQVLSHLGSGAEIGAATLGAALEGGRLPDGFNQAVWDRWNALTPREQADGFLSSDTVLVESFEALTPQQRAGLRIDLGFLPTPLSVASYAGMRLNEAAHHSWDVRVAFDDDAAIEESTAVLLVDHHADGLGFILSFSARADEVPGPAVVELRAVGHDLSIADAVGLVPRGAATTATFSGSADAVARLLSGRLTPGRTPTDVRVTGNVALEDLRRVLPGY